MERLAHLSAFELAEARRLHYRDVASDTLSLATVTFGGALLTVLTHCPLF